MLPKTKIKLLAVDIDGTLVRRDQSVSDANIDALDRVIDCGITVALFTGRSVKEALPARSACFGDRAGSVYLGCLSGAHICCGEPVKTFSTTAIVPDYISSVCRAINDVGMTAVGIADSCGGGVDHIVLAGDDIDYVRKSWLDTKSHFTERYIKSTDEFLTGSLPDVMRLTSIVPNSQREKALPAIEAIESLGLPVRVEALYAPNYDMFVVECFSTEINKYLGVKKIADSLGISSDEIAAIGDDINDLPMLENAEISAAMVTAPQHVKDAATVITDSVEDDGVAKFVNNLLNGKFG